jgi:hypothetical protein
LYNDSDLCTIGLSNLFLGLFFLGLWLRCG